MNYDDLPQPARDGVFAAYPPPVSNALWQKGIGCNYSKYTTTTHKLKCPGGKQIFFPSSPSPYGVGFY